jgi:hypothetical protein
MSAVEEGISSRVVDISAGSSEGEEQPERATRRAITRYVLMRAFDIFLSIGSRRELECSGRAGGLATEGR